MAQYNHVCSGASEEAVSANQSRSKLDVFADETEIQINFGSAVGEGVPAEGTATIAGASGSVDGMEVNGVEIMSGAEAFDTNSDTTATNVASNITANTSSPDYDASATGSVITVTAKTDDDNHEAVNGFTLVTTLTTMTSTDVDMAGGVNDTYAKVMADEWKTFDSPDVKKAVHILGTADKEVYMLDNI
jgi:hypothetical protein